jgi:hypothetical protein
MPDARRIEQQDPRKWPLLHAQELAADARPAVEAALNELRVRGVQLARLFVDLLSSEWGDTRQRQDDCTARGETAQPSHDEPILRAMW